MPGRALHVMPEEWPAVIWSFVYFFCLLAGYYILRPLRDEMGIQAGVANLPWLFTVVFVVMLAAVPLYGWVSARWPRERMLAIVYVFFIVNLLAFYLALRMGVDVAWVGRTFFVWVSVFNLFVVSVFWSFMVDLYDEAQGKRLFGLIAAGGTAGALAGPTLTASLVAPLGARNLLLVSAAFLGLAVFCIERLSAWGRMRERKARDAHSAEAPIGGSVWAGFAAVARSPYLLGVCFYLFSYTVLSTLLYFEMVRLVAAGYADPTERTRLFATLDLAVNVLTLAVQVLVTAKILERLGLTFALALMPAIAVIGFGVLSAVPTLAVLIAFGVLRRAGEFAVAKPAREILFTVLPREEKYKAKNFIDTAIYRGGDTISGWINTGLRALGLGLSAIALAAVPLAAAWLAVAIWLGRREASLREADEAIATSRRARRDDAAGVV